MISSVIRSAGMLYRISMLLLLFCGAAQAQELTLTVTVTHETCPNNGALSFSVENAVPAIPVNYKVYLLPNTTTPIWNSTTPSVVNLGDGNYLVVATQVVDGSPVTDQEEVTINDETVPLVYTITSVNAVCGPDGVMTVEVSSGNAVTYEIMSGPVTAAPQSSNVFSNIPAGSYQVRVIDNCGTGIVTTHTLFTDGPVLSVGAPFFPDLQLPACDLITVGNPIAATTTAPIAYPLDVVITVYPPDGSDPIVYTLTVPGGSPMATEVTQVIPFYYGINYYYDITVTDPCNNVYTLEDNLVDQTFSGAVGFQDLECGEKYMEISLSKYVPPFTVEFTTVPEGFDPLDFNAGHPGPFFGAPLSYGGEGNPVPLGIYDLTITDDCGRTVDIHTELTESEITPSVSATGANYCNGGLGGVEIIIPNFEIETASITLAPEEFEVPLDVSAYINDDGELVITDLLPAGSYVFILIDTCGNEYEAEADIIAASGEPNPFPRTDCVPGMGTVSMTTPNPPFTSITITAAPDAFGPTPFDASAYISSTGAFFSMDNLPPGTYTFTGGDDCVDSFTKTTTVTGYSVSDSNFQETLHCGSFDFYMSHTSTGTAFLSFWLQKLIDPVNNIWGHPETNVPYPEGTAPTADNSYQLANNATDYNLTFTGTFRVVKRFQTFGDGSQDQNTKNCIEILYEFEFNDDLQIIEIVSLTCSGDMADVQVIAVGAEPMTYKIIKKNNQPFVIDNGNNSIFTGLESASYEVEVRDPCGNIQNRPFNVAELPSLVSANTATDMEECDDNSDGVAVFDLSSQNDAVLDGQDPEVALLTYHATQADADAGINPLPLSYTSGTGTIYARVTHNTSTDCYAVTSFGLIVNPAPQLTMRTEWGICEGDSVTIEADPGYLYEWSTGAETAAITVSQAGSYSVTVTDGNGCTATETVQVSTSGPPVIRRINVTDWTDNNNVIIVILEQSSNQQNFEYSLDGITFQDSNTFGNLPPGNYTVYVRDRFGCGEDMDETYLLTYPRFFTPNGDGVNEKWRIKYSYMEPDMLVHIYDRYGKLLAAFDAASEGWDGNYGGRPLPATDYWFVVKRQNGREYKGHFSMLR